MRTLIDEQDVAAGLKCELQTAVKTASTVITVISAGMTVLRFVYIGFIIVPIGVSVKWYGMPKNG